MAPLLPFLRRHLLLLIAIGAAVAAWASAEPRTSCPPQQDYRHPLGRILLHGAHPDSTATLPRGPAPNESCD